MSTTATTSTSCASLRSRLIGAWSLVSYQAFTPSEPGDLIYPMTPHATGIVMYTPDGYVSVQLQLPGQARFSSADISGGTDEERAEAFRRYLGYTGPYYVDERESENEGESKSETEKERRTKPVLRHEMSIASFPNWMGSVQSRIAEISEDRTELTLRTAEPVECAGAMRHGVLKWRRLPRNVPTEP